MLCPQPLRKIMLYANALRPCRSFHHLPFNRALCPAPFRIRVSHSLTAVQAPAVAVRASLTPDFFLQALTKHLKNGSLIELTHVRTPVNV